MKDYQRILEQYPSSILLRHEWGQDASNVYHQIVDAWKNLAIGDRIFLLSRKKYGLKSTLTLLKEHGLNPIIVGKGGEDIRLVEIVKESTQNLAPLQNKRTITFYFKEKMYTISPGDAVFSQTDLDEGTRFLLDVFLRAADDLSGKVVADLGAGWGAISVILATEFPDAHIIACEKEIGAYKALAENVQELKNVEILQTDLTAEDEQRRPLRNKIDFIVSNFSFHIRNEEREKFFTSATLLLKQKGEFFFVTEGRFVALFEKDAQKLFTILDTKEYKKYNVFRCRKKQNT